MYYRKFETKKGTRYEVQDWYVESLTGKRKRATVSYTKDTPRARRQAERDLEDKIEKLISENLSQYSINEIKTFGELRDDYLRTWEVGVKPQTVKREKFVLKRLTELVRDDYLLETITPLLIKNVLTEYVKEYDPLPSTLGHVRSTLNKVFNHGLEYGIIKFSPMSSVRVTVSQKKRKQARENREKKFLENHELQAALDVLSRRENPNYYDLSLFLAFSGLRIGEVSALFEEDFDGEWIDISKSLQYHDLKVDEFYIDTTKTDASERELQLPKVAIDALNRAIERSRKIDEDFAKKPSASYRKSKSIFRTRFGTPITSKNFRQLLSRVEKELIETCEEKYGFKWKKHLTPHGFRHDNSTMLQDAGLPLKEVSGRLGHRNTETTLIYSHRTKKSQQNAVDALNRIAENEFQIKAIKSWSSKYSPLVYDLINEKKDEEDKKVVLSICDFRNILGIKVSYPPRHISANILPRITKDLQEMFHNFKIETLKTEKSCVKGYVLTWA